MSARFLSFVRLGAGGRAKAVVKKVLLTARLILWICTLAALSVGDAMALDSYWNEGNVQSAFSPENRHGRNPVHQAMPVSVWRNALVDAAHAEAAASGNFMQTVPILNLPGRGQDLNLALTYNSQLWHDNGTHDFYFDPDHGWPAPGWSLGFGKLVRVSSTNSAMLVDSDGTRHPFSGTGVSGGTLSAHTIDGSLIDYSFQLSEKTSIGADCGISSAVVKYPNGTVIRYTASGERSEFCGGRFSNEIFPTSITDASGNYISITYRNGSGPAIDTITDTLGRKVSFHYDANNALTAISGPNLNGGTRALIRLHYSSFQLFDETLPVIDAIFYPATNTGFWFDATDAYSEPGILKNVSERRAMNLTAVSLTEQGTVVSTGRKTRERKYNYPGSPTSCSTLDALAGVCVAGLDIATPIKLPAYSTMVESWFDKDPAAANTTYTTASTTYAIFQIPTGQRAEITYPDGGRYILTTDNSGLESQTELYDAGNKLLRKSTLAWETGAYGAPRVRRAETTDELNQVTAQEFSYGLTENQLIETRVYDYNGTKLLRKVHTDYLADPSYAEQHIFSLPVAIEVYDGIGGSLAARTEYLYDTEALVDTPGVVQHSDAYNPFAARIFVPGECEQVCSSDPNHPSRPERCHNVCTQGQWRAVYDAATRFRGNLTQIKRYAQAANRSGLITEVRQYDIAGNVRAVTGSTCCEQENTTYTLATQYAYPTTFSRGTSAANSTARVTTTASYDFSTGLPLSSTDANGRSLEAEYSQMSLRPEHIRQKTAQASIIDYEVVYTYNDADLSVTQEMLDAQQVGALKRIMQLNGLGLPRRESTLRAVGIWDFVDTKYDARGRLWQQSRPYRSGEVPQWSKISYDTLGRVTDAVAPDGSTATRVYNQMSRPADASLDPGQTLYTVDAWGRNRWSRFDALGRLVEVLEPKAGGSGSVFDGGSLATHYFYTALDQLQEVEHGSQWSGFLYDSLGRLTHQYVPEKARTLNEVGTYIGTGIFSDVYTYDARSNVTSHIDARGIKTTYNYMGDPLNRLYDVSYNTTGFGDTTHPILPANDVSLTYVSTGDLTRLESATTLGTREEFGYNDKGLLSDKTLTLGWPANLPLAIEYQYDKFDRLSDIRYPAEYGTYIVNRRELVHFDLDLAGRPKDVRVDNADYASSIAYNADSQLTSFITGSGSGSLTETFDFDRGTGLLNHQQVVGPNGPLLDLSYAYQRGNLVGRSGQVTSITNQLDEFHNRTYEYDVLGRVTKVTLGTSTRTHPQAYWTQQYAYDAYGNRTQSKAFGPVPPFRCSGNRDGLDCTETATPELPAERRDGLDGILYDPQTNRISTPGYAYDAEGNTVRAQRPDGTWQRIQYDTAGRLVAITDDSGATLESVMYGAGRQRLAKLNGDPDTSFYANTFYAWSGDQVIAEYTETAAARQTLTWTKNYVYLGGRLLATTTPGATPSNLRKRNVHYHHGDRVGPRLVTDTDGHSVSHEPYSFGTEALNTATGDDTRRFTSYDRSQATSLDYAVNRYYDPAAGRFTQVDPLGIHAGTLTNPQSLNLYAYVTNDPLNAVDPSGLVDSEDPCKGKPDGTEVGDGTVCSGGVAVNPVIVDCCLPDSISGGKGLLPGSTGRSGLPGSSGGVGSDDDTVATVIDRALGDKLRKLQKCEAMKRSGEEILHQQTRQVRNDVRESASVVSWPLNLANLFNPATGLVTASLGVHYLFAYVFAEDIAEMANLQDNINTVLTSGNHPICGK